MLVTKQCTYCGGNGEISDGTVENLCGYCGGTGIAPITMFAFIEVPVLITWIDKDGNIKKQQVVHFSQE